MKFLNGVWHHAKKELRKIKGKHNLTFVSDLFLEASEHLSWQISLQFSKTNKKGRKRNSHSSDKLRLTLVLSPWHKVWLHLCPGLRTCKRGHDGPLGSKDRHKTSWHQVLHVLHSRRNGMSLDLQRFEGGELSLQISTSLNK